MGRCWKCALQLEDETKAGVGVETLDYRKAGSPGQGGLMDLEQEDGI